MFGNSNEISTKQRENTAENKDNRLKHGEKGKCENNGDRNSVTKIRRKEENTENRWFMPVYDTKRANTCSDAVLDLYVG